MTHDNDKFNVTVLWPEQEKALSSAHGIMLGDAIDVAFDDLLNGAETVLIRNIDIAPEPQHVTLPTAAANDDRSRPRGWRGLLHLFRS